MPADCTSLEQGLNPLFDDRADEFLVYEEPLNEALKKRQRPDRIYGLSATTRLERLLSATNDGNGKRIEDSIRITPFRPSKHPLLFPFLVLEAKSEKGSDSFSDIENQSAFAIRELIKLQDDLKSATKRKCQWD